MYQYCKAADQVKAFEASERFQYMKGSFKVKKETRHYKNKVYEYQRTYVVRVNYVNGKRKYSYQYVKEKDLANVERKLADKQKNRQTYNKLKKIAETLFAQLKKIFGNKSKVLDEIVQHRNNNEEFRKKDKNIVTPLGEQVRSRAECLLASLIFAFNIPYIYEAAIKVNKYDELHPDFTLFLRGKRIQLEYLGMMDDDDYIARQVWKEQRYEEAGYRMGKNLVYLASRDDQDIDARKVVQVFMGLLKGKMPQEIVYV